MGTFIPLSIWRWDPLLSTGVETFLHVWFESSLREWQDVLLRGISAIVILRTLDFTPIVTRTQEVLTLDNVLVILDLWPVLVFWPVGKISSFTRRRSLSSWHHFFLLGDFCCFCDHDGILFKILRKGLENVRRRDISTRDSKLSSVSVCSSPSSDDLLAVKEGRLGFR